MNKLKTILFFLAPLIWSCSSTIEDQKKERLLPIYGEKKLSGEAGSTDTLFHQIGNFSFTNQYGESVDQSITQDKIYIADFFFATCQSICPKMSTQLTRLQDSIMSQNDVIILSHTVNPMHDTVEVLKIYGEKYRAKKGKWHLLTGDRKEIYSLAKNDYLVNALEDNESDEGFLHSELFLLVDKQKRVRGLYDGTDSLQVDKLIRDLKILKSEKE
jgi:protein SCO1/2